MSGRTYGCGWQPGSYRGRTWGCKPMIQTLGRLKKPTCPTPRDPVQYKTNQKQRQQNQIKGTGERQLGRLLISGVSGVTFVKCKMG